jgi:glycine cleavage system aminomethyltransferase T
VTSLGRSNFDVVPATSSLAFLSPSPSVRALSPLDAELEAAGAAFEVRGGWRVATRVGEPEDEARALEHAVGWADLSFLPKFEVAGEAGTAQGTARREGDAWWCPVTRTRTLVLGATVPGALDVTTQHGGLLIAGPVAREAIARFCAIDLRPRVSPVGAFRPGSVARTPGAVLVEAPDRFLILFGAALARYVWTVVSDAGRHLGGRPVGADAVRIEEPAGA